MCAECCHKECSVCQRGLCQKCDARERKQLSPGAVASLFPYVSNLYETEDDGTGIYSCLRCILRRGIGFTKATAKAANPDGPPVDGYGREVDTRGLVDPRPGLQVVREQLRREFDPGNRGALIGVMEGIQGSLNDFLGGPTEGGARSGPGFLMQGVGGTAGAMAPSYWHGGTNADDDKWLQDEEEQGEDDDNEYQYLHEENEDAELAELGFL